MCGTGKQGNALAVALFVESTDARNSGKHFFESTLYMIMYKVLYQLIGSRAKLSFAAIVILQTNNLAILQSDLCSQNGVHLSR
jgi:ribosomal protein L20A (L18A)